MKLIRTLTATAVLIGAFTAPAMAATDLGDGRCFDEGQATEGLWDGSYDTDAGCITPDEYAERFSVDSLAERGIITDVTDLGDGTVSATLRSGVSIVLVGAPLERSAAATDGVDPPRTVGEAFARPAFGVHPI